MKQISKNLHITNEILKAYSDCNDAEGERNLDYLASKSVDGALLAEIMPIAIPDGYNGFDPKKSIAQLIEVFGLDAEYFVAREGSVCIYIRPNKNLWLNKRRGGMTVTELDADEIMFCPKKQMFRIWWD